MTKVGKQIRSLPRYFEELAFSIGQYFLEPLGIAVTYLTNFLKYLTALPDEMKQTIASFVMMGTASSGAVAGLAGMFKMAPLLGGALSFLISPLGLLVAAAGALAGAFIMDIGGIRTKTMPLFKAVAKIIETDVLPVIQNLIKYFGFVIESGDALNDWLTHLPEPIRPLVQRLGEFIALIQDIGRYIAFVLLYGDELNDWLTHLPEPIQPILLELGRLITVFQEAIPAAIETLRGILTAVMAGIIESIGTAWTTIRTWTEENWSTIQAFITAVLDWIRSFVDLTLKNITRIFGSAWKIIRVWTEENWPLIQKTIETVMTWILNIISHVASLITRFWDAWGQDLLSIAQTAWDIIRTAIETVINVILGIIKTVMLLIQGDWKGAWEEVRNIARIIWDGILAIINLALDKIKELLPRFVKAGKNLMKGLLEGMEKMKDKIVEWIMGLVRGIVDRIKDFFKMGSPSRLMAGYGREIMGGFIRGLEEMRPAFESQLAMTLAPVMQVAAPQAAASPVLVQGGHTYQFNLSAHYAQVQSPASIMDDLQAMEMLAGARG